MQRKIDKETQELFKKINPLTGDLHSNLKLAIQCINQKNYNKANILLNNVIDRSYSIKDLINDQPNN